MKITLTRNEIQAALLFASRDQTRYTLCSLHVEIKPELPPLLVTTDGRRLCCIKASCPDELPTVAESVTLDAEFLKQACQISSAAGRKNNLIYIETDGEKATATVIGAGVSFSKDKGVLNGYYPGWKQVLPDLNQRKAINGISLNAHYLADYAKAKTLLGLRESSLQINFADDLSPVEIQFHGCDYFYSVLMPMKPEAGTSRPLDFKSAFLKKYLAATPSPAN